MLAKRLIGAVLSIALLVSWTAPAFAAEGRSIFDRTPDAGSSGGLRGEGNSSVPSAQTPDQDRNASVQQLASEIAARYDINIAWDNDNNGDSAIATSTLQMLDTSLGYVTPSIVRQVSAHYQRKSGQRLTFAFSYGQSNYRFAGMEMVGLFEQDKARINIYIPYTSNGTFTTGAAPITIVHEFGHALHMMCEDVLDGPTLEREWRGYNGSQSYNNGYFGNYSESTFMSDYGATSYHEDFAEVFAHAFVRNKAGQGMTQNLTSNGSYTGLANKILYIESLLQRVFNDSATAVSNLHRVFSTPTTMQYQGLTLWGSDLQFIGFSAPNYLRNGILGIYGLTAQSSTWITDIGGWQVLASDGRYYLVFPGGGISRLTTPLSVAA